MELGLALKPMQTFHRQEGIYFAPAQNDCSDEEIISFWLTVSTLEKHEVPMFVTGLYLSSLFYFPYYTAHVMLV
jgi:hypothetical protein